MDGPWMDGWVGGWMGGKAGLRIAYSNQKFSKNLKSRHPKSKNQMTRLGIVSCVTMVHNQVQLYSTNVRILDKTGLVWLLKSFGLSNRTSEIQTNQSQTGLVPISDVWDQPYTLKPNYFLFSLSNQTFRFWTLTVKLSLEKRPLLGNLKSGLQ